MKKAVNNFDFKYFIILSSRNLFYNNLNHDKCNALSRIESGVYYKQINTDSWHWPLFLQTKLSKYIVKNNLLFSSCAHEGLTFIHKSCIDIVHFLCDNDDIRTDLFNFDSCVEEYALQTICINLTDCYFNIGIWTGDDDMMNKETFSNNLYVYKTKRI